MIKKRHQSRSKPYSSGAKTKNLSEGVHRLRVSDFRIKDEGHYQFHLSPVGSDCKKVIRTFKKPEVSKELRDFLGSLYVDWKNTTLVQACRNALGVEFLGVIERGSSNVFMNLVCVKEVLLSYDNSDNPVNDLKIARGGQGARQTSDDLL